MDEIILKLLYLYIEFFLNRDEDANAIDIWNGVDGFSFKWMCPESHYKST